MHGASRPQRVPASVRAHSPTMEPVRWTLTEKVLHAITGEVPTRPKGEDWFWLSEEGWADYLDKEYGQSYAMNERPSKTTYPKFNPNNPIDIIKDAIEDSKRFARDPLEAMFPTIGGDTTGARSWGKYSEVESRNFKPPKGYGPYGLKGGGFFGFDLRPSDKELER